jgi:hypothetical protein
MKTPKKLHFIAIIFSIFILQGCLSIFSGSKFKVETDSILGTTRIRVNMEFVKAVESKAKLIKLTKSVTKEKNLNSVVTYQVFDILEIDKASFGLRNEMVLIVDQVPYVIFPEVIDSNKAGFQKMGLTSDKSEPTPATAIENRTYWLNYFLEESHIEKIRVAQQVHFRYYAGPDVITVKLSRSDLKNLMRMIYQTI